MADNRLETIVDWMLKIIPDHYPVPDIQDFNHALEETPTVSKIDLVRVYHQIPIALLEERSELSIETYKKAHRYGQERWMAQ